MTNKKLRIGFIGAGRHATRILYPSLRLTDLELVALASLDENEAIRNARWFGAQKYYLNHLDLLENERNLDAILVAVPPPSYLEVISAVLDAGLPVWSEKPAAGNAREALELEKLAAKRGLPVCVGYMKRFAPAYVLAKEVISKSDFGSPSFFNGKFAMGGGVYPDEYTFLVDNSVHMADLALFFMGEVKSVQSACISKGGRIAYAVLLEFASGAVGTLHLSTMQSWRAHNERVEITGVGSAVVVDNVVKFEHFVPEGPGFFWEPNFTVPVDANQTLVLTGYAGQLQHFVEVVRDGVEPRATLNDSRRALELVDLIYQSTGGLISPDQRAGAW